MLTPKKKITKKELKHDPLLDTLERGQEFYEKNSKQILTVLGVVVIIFLLLWGWMNSRESYTGEAMLADTKTSILALQGMNSNIISELELVIAEYGSNDLVAMSMLQLGEARLDSGDYAGAKELFSKLSNSSDSHLKAAGRLRLAALAEKEQDLSTAAMQYKAVAALDLPGVSRQAKLQSAYAFAAAEQLDEARRIVADLLADNPTGRFRDQVKYLEGKVQEK
jgi:predicted negative regulator of RcsB-dependent stress response